MEPLLQIRATVGSGVFLAMPEPSGMQLTYQDLDSNESGRTADGTMFRDRIDVKRRIDVTWKWLSAKQMSDILKTVQNQFFEVRFLDPKTGAFSTMIAYVGDRTPNYYSVVNGMYGFRDFSIGIIEQ